MKFAATLETAGFKCGDIFGKDCIDHNGMQGKWDLNTTGYFGDMSKCYYNFKAEMYKGMDSSMYNKISDGFGLHYMIGKYSNHNLVKAYNSQLFRMILNTLSSSVKSDQAGKKDFMKFLGLSGHETNLVPLMMAFNLINIECTWKRFQGDYSDSKCHESPSFAANIIFELIKREGKYFVRGLYNGNKIEICSGFNTNTDYRCPFDTFASEL